jgi:hypothetical protein
MRRRVSLKETLVGIGHDSLQITRDLDVAMLLTAEQVENFAPGSQRLFLMTKRDRKQNLAP